MSDRQRVLDRLRRGPVHSIELRREGYTGNPSQRVNELCAEGHTIRRDPEPWKDGEGKRRGGVRYTLVHDAGDSTGEAGGTPCSPSESAAGLVGEAHDDSGLTPLSSERLDPEGPGEGQESPGTLFDTGPDRSSYAHPEAA